MGPKRSHEQVDSPSQEHDSQRATSSDSNEGPSIKRQRRDGKRKGNAKEGSAEYAKKRARTIERLFQSGKDLPGHVRDDLERELATHRATISDKAFQKKRSAMISKYHMVRFFERKKAIRLLKQARKQINETTDPEELKRLQRELHIAKVDEAYTLFHPHAEPYISMYGRPKASKTDSTPVAKAALEAERPPIWHTVEEALEGDPGALVRLRERRAPDESPANPQPRSAQQNPRPARAATKPKVDDKKAADGPPVRPKAGDTSKPTQMNRRERRRLMHQTVAAIKKEEEGEDDGEGYFDAA